ncbi:MAG: alpha/beta hydrolase [Polaromonas sp.]|uniref:alpha/beta hydrolase n=1 Tax=Polaromonas sp. TaxID=1869339 RepID=UPI0025D88C19|nr:alpha/beta hydrolase [Polaromonas sp.]MBI2725766.1 alpha/beta hydrolase [Polaromonas sp.]
MNLLNSKLPRRSLLAMLPGLLTACSAVDLLNATVAVDTYERDEGLAYGPDPRQKLDVYRPRAPVANAPMVVFFYGGSWSSGDRSDYRFVGEALASRGIVTVVADYRLSPEFLYPVFILDSALATSWAFRHAPDYGVSRSRIFVMGHSAGAYNAAMLALDKRWLEAFGLFPTRLAGWIGLAGPYDFLPIGDKKTQVAFRWPDTPQDSQPLFHVSKASPPALLLAPAKDSVVDPVRSTVSMARKLKAAGVPVESELYDSVGHVTLVASMASVLRGRAPVLDRIAGFVNTPR